MKRTVFITGYPRQLARLIAEESLEDPEVTAVMLARTAVASADARAAAKPAGEYA